MNGGGGDFVVNFNHWFGFAMDLQGYGAGNFRFSFPPSSTLPSGASGVTSANMFTYMFGPQVKFYGHKIEPFFHTLAGGAHSNFYANLATQAGLTGNVNTSGDGFAFAVGGGFDIPLSKRISIRPAEVDYLPTRFTNQFANNTQNNLRYSAGIVLTFGGTK